MLRTVIVALTIAAFAEPAEIKTGYANIDKNAPFQIDHTQPLESHALFKKEDPMHPVFKTGEPRARIEEIKPVGPVVNDHLQQDQSLPSTEVNRIDNLQVPNFGYVPSPDHHQMAFPNYAPGYGYDNDYYPSNSYDVYSNGLANIYPEPEPSPLGLFWNQMPFARSIVNFIGHTFSWIFQNTLVLALGSILTVSLCSYTDLCTINFHGVGPIREEMRSLMSPERLERISQTADFVKNAIDKYQKIQKVSEIANSKR